MLNLLIGHANKLQEIFANFTSAKGSCSTSVGIALSNSGKLILLLLNNLISVSAEGSWGSPTFSRSRAPPNYAEGRLRLRVYGV